MDDTYKVKFIGFNALQFEAYSKEDALRQGVEYLAKHGWTAGLKGVQVELIEVNS